MTFFAYYSTLNALSIGIKLFCKNLPPPLIICLQISFYFHVQNNSSIEWKVWQIAIGNRSKNQKHFFCISPRFMIPKNPQKNFFVIL